MSLELILLVLANAFLIGIFIVLLTTSKSHTETVQKSDLIALQDSISKEVEHANAHVGSLFKTLGDFLHQSTTTASQAQKNQLDSFAQQLHFLMKSNQERLDKLGETIESRLKSIQENNAKQLEEMRATVDEKLHKTLEQRLGESFKAVSDRLEQVHKGLGEMQTLAVGVGDLKKVLSNVKTRGILGEIQLGNILEQIMAPEQYAKNVKTKPNASEFVEFAIKLPGNGKHESVLLPIDSKFPMDVYQALLHALDVGDVSAIEMAGKLLEQTVEKNAKDIRDKYIDIPHTTDFGILFVPVEGLYAEIVRRTGLFETIQRKYKVVIAGPTTLAAFLNSLHMGFRTLAIEKRSGEVWKVLGAVKTEFDRFGDVLKKAQDKLTQANKELDDLVGTRTRQIQRQLRDVEGLPAPDPEKLLES